MTDSTALLPDHEPLSDVAPVDVAVAPKLRRFGFGFWLAAAWVGLVMFGAAFGPLLPLQSPSTTDPCAPYATPQINLGLGTNTPKTGPGAHCTSASRPDAPPTTKHWLGTDTEARDTLARLVAGARTSMIVGLSSIALALLIGGTIGVVAGYFRGIVDGLLMAMADVLLTFPALVLALVIVSLRHPGLSTAVLAITVIGIPGTARLVRANALTYSKREFVTAARVLGARDRRIIVREIVPNLVPVLVSYACLGIALAIVAEGSLAYLNLSVQDPASSWGLMILNGQAAISTDPQVTLIPAAAFLLTVLSFNVLGEKVRAAFGIRGRVL